MSEQNLDELCNCGHTSEYHSGGYGDCMTGSGCDCRSFDSEPAAPPAPQGSGEHKLVADSPTFAYSLAMFLTRNGQRGNAPEMQEEIEMFMKDSRQSTLNS